ncbi:MAG TPA: SufD family Fe-S cluster assembly protein [Acidimicrobiales bacterium]|nr:SufD family Fe-S cluster assembly protein [Acidimicrobiales bacterium]
MPSEAEEIWRYSGIDDFDLGAFSPPAPGRDLTPGELAQARSLADHMGTRCALVVTRNGVVVGIEPEPGLDSATVTVAGAGPLGSGADDGEAFALAPPGGDGDALSVVHDAFLSDVVLVSVGRAVELAGPVVIVHLVDAEPVTSGSVSVFPHTVVRVGPGASAGVVELFAGYGPRLEAAALVVPVSQLEVADGARLAYGNVQILGGGTTQVGLQRSIVGRDAEFRSLTVSLGGRYARVRTDSELAGEGGRSSLLAAYLGTAAQVHDFRTLQDHSAGRTESELLFTGAVADRARSVYSGLIRIHKGARRADARQTNHNLVLSEGAHADSVPNLDIDENDVRCSHASTVGPIDEEQRYYLESRGVEPVVAERLIVLGFFSDLAARSPFPAMVPWVEESVAERLAGRLPAEAGAGHG